jgi:hypothetical protein
MFFLKCDVKNVAHMPGGQRNGQTYEPSQLAQVQYKRPINGSDGERLQYADLYIPNKWGDQKDLVDKTVMIPVEVYVSQGQLKIGINKETPKPNFNGTNGKS